MGVYHTTRELAKSDKKDIYLGSTPARARRVPDARESAARYNART
jgi:hypothetical protein